MTPQPAASSVAGPGKITNVGIQDICPADTAEHLKIGTQDPAASALALDALKHSGPAKALANRPQRLHRALHAGGQPGNGRRLTRRIPLRSWSRARRLGMHRSRSCAAG